MHQLTCSDYIVIPVFSEGENCLEQETSALQPIVQAFEEYLRNYQLPEGLNAD